MRAYTRKPYFIIGIFTFILALVLLCLCAYQPNNIKGYVSHGTSEGYEITEVLSGSPADLAGLCEGDVIVSINTRNMVDFWQQYVKGKTFDVSYKYTPFLFTSGATYRCSMLDGSVKTFTIPAKAPLFYVLGLLSRDDIINFITGGLFIILGLELILMISGITSFWSPFGLGTPNLFGSIALVIALVYSFLMFSSLLAHIPRQSSLSLRFFLMGICFGALPALSVILLRTLTASYIAEVNETLVTILPLLSIPVAVFCSVFQAIKPEYDQIFARIMTGVGTVVILVLISLSFSPTYATIFTLMCLSPFVFLLVEKPITAFLYPKLTYVQRDLDSLEKHVFRCETENAVYDIISQWLFTNLNAKFVFFSRLSVSDETVSTETLFEKAREGFCDMNVLNSMIEERIQDRIHWDGLLTHPGRGCSCPLYQSHEITGYIFVGARSRNDMFSSMEMRLLPPVARILMEALIMIRLKSQAQYVSDMQNQIVFSFADMIESRDGSTGLHVKRTSQIVDLLSKRLRTRGTYDGIMTPVDYEMIALAAPLHDIGKIKIPDAILSKPGKLTDEEFATIKTHPVEGEKIISKTMTKIEDEKYLEVTRYMALYHHEKWNGTGYPEGLKGDEIPVCARIMAVADVFDALCSARCYKKAFTIDEAYAIFEESSGTHFEPVLVEILKELRPELEQIYQN